MKVISRWWQRYGGQIFWGLVSVAITWLVYVHNGWFLSELLSLIYPSWLSSPIVDRQALYQDRTIQELNQKIEILERENQTLRQIVNYQQKSAAPLIPARVIARSADAWWQIITIDVGSRKGVSVDNTVISVGGLVGRVTSVTPNTSRVLLISDYNSRVGAILPRTGYQGVIKGQGTSVGIMEFYAKVADVRIGDVVATSNFSTIFPPGIPIGKIIEVDLNKSPAPEAKVEFTAPLDYLDWVLVNTESQPLFEQSPPKESSPPPS